MQLPIAAEDIKSLFAHNDVAVAAMRASPAPVKSTGLTDNAGSFVSEFYQEIFFHKLLIHQRLISLITFLH